MHRVLNGREAEAGPEDEIASPVFTAAGVGPLQNPEARNTMAGAQ